MYRGIVLAVAIAAFGIFSTEAIAQSDNSPSTQHPQPVEQESGKQQITADELPEGVKQALKSDVLKAWQVSEVYKLGTAAQDAEATYEVYFTNAEQKRSIARFNEEGKSVASPE